MSAARLNRSVRVGVDHRMFRATGVTPSIEPEAREVTAPSSILQVSNRRWLVLWLLLLITIINFIDRQTVSVLAPVIRASLHLSNAQYGRIVAAFQFGMMTGEFPMGWLMDRWGVRFGLLGAVLWWSAATGSQVLTRSGLQLGITRFWMGTGECGNYSGGMKAIFGAFAPGELCPTKQLAEKLCSGKKSNT